MGWIVVLYRLTTHLLDSKVKSGS